MSQNSELTQILSMNAAIRAGKRSSAARSSSPVLSFRSKQVPAEPEDARITGATRSLYRRLLALNLRKPATALRETEAYIEPLTA